MQKYAALMLIFLSACVSQQAVSFENVSVSVEIADTPEEWQRGLMYRDSLPESSGMLFAFPDEAPRSFWMKSTKIPLDIIFISASMTVVDVQAMEPCSKDPCVSYRSAAPAKYALEVNKGFAERNGIRTGHMAGINA